MNAPPARSARSLRARLLLLFGAVAVSLGICEAIIRLAYAHEVDIEQLRARNDATLFGSFTRPSAHPELLYELRPATDVPWQGCRVVTDAEGHARIAADATPTPGAVRVALLGDSTAFGWRVEYEDSYGERLRLKLEGATGQPVCLKNFGVPGYNSQHLKVVLRDRVLPWKPDLLVLHYDHNDPDPIDVKPRNYIAPEYGENFLRSALIKFVLRRVQRARTSGLTEVASADPANPDRFLGRYRYSGMQYQRHWQEMAEIAALLEVADVPVIAFVFNTKVTRTDDPDGDLVYTLLHRPAVQHLLELGFVVVDMYPAAQTLMRENDWPDLRPTWIDRELDGHPNPRGHEFIATLLFDGIREQERLARVFGL